MCGIAGFSITNKENIDAVALASSLLWGIESRGFDASGVAWYEGDKSYYQKGPVRASVFTDMIDGEMPTDVKTAICHTRAMTQGAVSNNKNNHPIHTEKIVGVHNGMVWNDNEIFKQLGEDKRIAEVDSEAIFALINEHEDPIKALEEIDGSASVGWFDIYKPGVLYVARLWQSPLAWTQTEAGSFIFASEAKNITDTAKFCDLTIEPVKYLDNGTFMVVENGIIKEVKTFTCAGSYYNRGWSSACGYYWEDDDNKKDDDTTAELEVYSDSGDTVGQIAWLNDLFDQYEYRYSVLEYDEVYAARENEILNVLEDENGIEIEDVIHLGAWIRPGDEVITKLHGEDVVASVVTLPWTFPEGLYTLAVDTSDEGVVLIQRTIDQIEDVEYEGSTDV